MTTFQKWLISILIVFGALFLYFFKTGFEFYACATAETPQRFTICDQYSKQGFGFIPDKK
ncbi:hypothetical protein HYS91_05180 [Candidatus Daviesbacteria bacterium]|nr:hypothetical protein [Candidatus Daviesbacteria bacterium]